MATGKLPPAIFGQFMRLAEVIRHFIDNEKMTAAPPSAEQPAVHQTR